MTTIEELNYLKSMIEIRYGPAVVRMMMCSELLFGLSIISMLLSMVLFVIIVNQSLGLMVISVGWFITSLIIFFWIRRIKDKASKIMSLIVKISGLEDPSELDLIDPNDYGLDWKVEK